MEQQDGSFFSQYIMLRLKDWFRQPHETRQSVLTALRSAQNTHLYLSVGLKPDADVILWRFARSVEELQGGYIDLRRKTEGYVDVTAIYTGVSMPSTYTGEEGRYEMLIDPSKRSRYLSVYPFTKTPEWYLLDADRRRKIMGEHIAIGRKFPEVRQLLLYSFGADDQEFVVSYEFDDMKYYIKCVMALRESESRLYTLKDTPVFTGVRADNGIQALD